MIDSQPIDLYNTADEATINAEASTVAEKEVERKTEGADEQWEKVDHRHDDKRAGGERGYHESCNQIEGSSGATPC